LAEPPTPSLPVFLGQMVHSAMFAVDEAGTIAAAATAEMLVGGIGPGHSFTMIVDRPFLCAIRDRRSGAILFLAAISDPTAS
jgi:serpin B